MYLASAAGHCDSVNNVKPFATSAAFSVVVANMIGTGVFTSLGFQLMDIQSPTVIISLWVLGGIIALSGALCYAELGAALPRSGGEYHFVREVYGPLPGFVSGWVSASVGFAAPVALAAITFASYLAAAFPELHVQWTAAALIVAATIAHTRSRSTSGGVQTGFTILKLLLIVGFCIAATWHLDEPVALDWSLNDSAVDSIFSPAFAVALIYVNYAYTGWNSATYLTGELRDPQRQLPWVLTAGTGTVLILYVALHVVFLRSAPAEAMAGELEIGYIVAQHVFGPTGATAMAIILASLLISTVSSMVLAGPRVLQVAGEDYASLRWLSAVGSGGVPQRAIWVQAIISLTLVATATFDQVLLFAGFILALNSAVTIGGVMLLRMRNPDLPRPFKVPLYPVPPLIFLICIGATLTFLATEHLAEVLFALAMIVIGVIIYLVVERHAASDSAAAEKSRG